MTRRAALIAAVASLAVGAQAADAKPATAQAADAQPVTAYLNIDSSGHCPLYGDLEVCTGQVPSFDGSKLDVDVTLPPGARLRRGSGTPDSHPLIVMVHGAGGTDKPNKYEFQSTDDVANGTDKYHWNSHWFATHGYYVVTPTQRGYIDEGAAFAWQPRTPAPSSGSVDLPNGTIKLTSREFSARDDQWLAAQVARSFDVDRTRIVATGRTSGGGETWQLATENRWTFPHSLDPKLPVLRLRAVVPRTTWTDLLYSFSPHGHGGGPAGDDPYEAAFGAPGASGPRDGLYGAAKASYLAFVYLLIANRQGVLEAGQSTTPSEEGRVNLHEWVLRALAGDPEKVGGIEDPTQTEIRRGLTYFRSVYYLGRRWQAQPAGERVAIFAIQGWTDELFQAVEPFRQFKYLKRLHPGWPMRIALADVGSAPAQNPAPEWRELNSQAWDFLATATDTPAASPTPASTTEPAVESYPTRCGAAVGTPAGAPLTAGTPEGLSSGTLTAHYETGGSLTSATGAFDPDSLLTEPNVAQRVTPCLSSTGLTLTGYTATSGPLDRDATYVGLGSVTVPYQLTGTRANLHVRLWDVPPAGATAPDDKTLLVTRGTYTFLVPDYDTAAGTVRVPLFGNHWKLRAGHRLRLDLTQVDAPYFRPANAPSSLSFGPPTLTLPIAEPQQVSVPGLG
jgi:dienelactone hydrolase